MLADLEPHGHAVNDVAWAPNMGRSYHLIASAGQDQQLKVHRLARAPDGLKAESASQLVRNLLASKAWQAATRPASTRAALRVRMSRDVRGD